MAEKNEETQKGQEIRNALRGRRMRINELEAKLKEKETLTSQIQRKLDAQTAANTQLTSTHEQLVSEHETLQENFTTYRAGQEKVTQGYQQDVKLLQGELKERKIVYDQAKNTLELLDDIRDRADLHNERYNTPGECPELEGLDPQQVIQERGIPQNIEGINLYTLITGSYDAHVSATELDGIWHETKTEKKE